MEEEMPLGAGDGPPISNNANKRLSVERIYQKKSQLEHILLRPDTYIGSVEKVTQPMWVFDEEKAMMIQREVTFVPGLFKIFDEILVNAADNKQRDANMNTIKINIDAENNQISVWNNGKGIPVVEHKTEKMYVPTMIFGHLLTSSNYNDFEKKVTGGRNGYGAKLCNIFSTKFTVETSSGEYKKCFRQTWQKNMGFTKEPTIKDAKSEDFTCVSFSPDLSKFQMDCLDKDIVDVFSRRAYDIAGSTKGVKVILNGKRIPVKNFKDYINLFIKDKEDENGQPLKIVYSEVNPRWEVALTLSDKGFQQASFVNSIATTKGGRHIDHVSDQIVKKLIEIVQKKDKGGIKIKPFQIKNHLWVFVNCLIENPTFDSQTKENMTLQAKSFGSKCSLTDDFMKQASKCGIVESILSWMKFKAQTQLNKKSGTKNSKLKGIPKLDDANNAGTKSSQSCTLILTEGDSAKSLAVAGLGVIGRDKYGVFPLRGKLLNVREASHKQIMDNAEINNIIKIMGLQFKNKYNEPEDLKTLRYGKLMIMTDQDHDGSHIKGLLVNFIHHFWPNLLKYNVVEQFITPIVKAFKGKNEHAFYSMPEFEEWQKETPNFHTWKIKYYKGLGTSTAKEAKEYFTDIERHRIRFKYGGAEDDASITLAFSKKKIEDRKTWLTNFMEDRKRRNELGLPELYLYGKETQRVTFNEFINKELILFSEVDNIRSIPSMVDGFKPGQRKVMFTCFKRNITKEIKVAQLAGSVGEHSAYHHGEASLMGTIVNLAQNFVGSNNLNLLMPQGQFGTRLHGGKDAASPRYIFTYLNPLTRLVFSPLDDALLKHLYDDNQKIEPEWYIPIIPMVLVNGADGIGTGWSTKIQNFDIREIVANLKRMLDGEEPLKMLPSFKNFKGTIDELSESRFIISGEISILDDNTIEISELPIRVWTQNYKEDVLEPMLHGTDKTEAMITDYKEYHTESTVRFVVKMTTQKLAQAEAQGIHKVFKIQNSCTTNSMVLFDHNGCIRRYDKAEDILKDFYELRLKYYVMRKNYMEGMLEAESSKLDNIARFILEKIEGTIVIENKKKKDIIQMLVRHGYDSDPVKTWKAAQNKGRVEEEESQESQNEEDMDGPDYNYLLSLQLWSLSKEKKDELLKQKEAKAKELAVLKTKSPSVLWKEDLEAFLIQLNEKEQQERDDEEAIKKKGVSKPGKLKSRTLQLETMPSPHGIRVVPRVDSAIKLKAEKADNKKGSKKIKKELNLDLDDDMKTEVKEEPKSLAERLNIDKKKIFKPKAAKPVNKSPVNKSPNKSPTKSPKGKKKKKRNPWSSCSESEDELSDIDMDDGDGSFIAASTKERGPRRAANKINYSFGESEDGISSDSDNDDEFKPTENNENHSEPVVLPSDSPEPPRNSAITAEFSDSEDDGFDLNSVSKTSSVKGSSVPTSQDDIFSSKPSVKPAAENKKAAPKKPPAEKKKAAPKKPPSEKQKAAPKKPPGEKKKPAAKKDNDKPAKTKTVKRPAYDSDSSMEFNPVVSKKKSKKNDSDDDFAMDDFDKIMDDSTPPPKPSGRSRAKPQIKYNFSDSDEDY